MNLADITTKCYILALIIRDDGERLLLGDGAYEFKDSQQHFIANTYANDVVELQGTDGQMLAGQVRRTATQTFAGYIGDATFSKQAVESARRDFLMFFRKKHYYTAVYVFSDGTAIQRDRGYIVNAPSVPELYQRFPEWSVGLNFEDPNYYEYAEDDLGQEIAAHKVELELSTAMSGGLIWDGDGAVSDDLSYVGTEIPGEGKNFQLTDTGTATLKSAELLGDAEQTTYSGKNLFNIKSFLTDRGVSYTENSDGSVTFGLTQALHSTPFQFSNTDVMVSIQALITNVTSTNAYIELYKSDGTSRVARLSQTVQKAENVAASKLSFNWGTAGNVTVKNAQLELGSTATTYEPYVGGTASPNPDYPQAVNTVTGEQTVKVVGKNLFDKDNADTANGYLSGSTGAFVAGGGSYATKNATFLPAGDYVASQMLEKVCHYALDGSYIGLITRTGSNNEKFTMPSVGFVRLQFPSSFNADTFQLELGSTATAYEPYQAQTLPVNLGKNLVYTGDRTNQGITFAYNATTGETSVSGTASTTYANALQISEYLPTGTYTVSIQDTLPFTVGIGTRNSANTRTPHGITAGNKSLTFTLTEPAFAYDVYLTALTGGSQINATFKLQVERGSTATSFAPYFTPIELVKIGDYQDRIYKDSGKWYIEKQVGKVVLDGTSQNWFYTNGVLYTDSIADYSRSDNTPLSTHFIGQINANGAGATLDEHIAFSSNAVSQNRLYIRYDSMGWTTADAFKTWLGTHNTTVYYALATPTTTEITNSELVGQLERLQHAHTYADITNFSITATGPNLPAFLKVVAFGDDAIPQGGYVWEDGGTGGATTITVDGVDNAQPIWTVVGPATNPSLTNITTGESIQWTGVVPNGQTLVVNMADMTASLSGANVFEFISGSWITLQAGNNRVSYSATAATGIATLEWNGVVG